MSGAGERLLEIFHALDAQGRDTLVAFAEFLAQRGAAVAAVPVGSAPAPALRPQSAEPVAIPRPVEESVVAAIKRLRRTYPMLDRNAMLNEVYTLMNAHVLEGRSAGEVIDELEQAFEQRYRDWQADAD